MVCRVAGQQYSANIDRYIGSALGFYSCDGWNETSYLKNERVLIAGIVTNIYASCSRRMISMHAQYVLQSNILYMALALINVVKNR